MIEALLALTVAHAGGIPTTARPTAPMTVGVVVDDSFTFGWTDFDDTADTLTYIDWSYTAAPPPTFRPGTPPYRLTGDFIAREVPEADLANELTWDTSTVPAGSYFIWSLADDPPFANVAVSRGVVTVAHEGDPVFPAIILGEPDGWTDVAHLSYDVTWEAFDPDGTGRVTLEAMTKPDGSDAVTIATDLPVSPSVFTWDTSALPDFTDFILKATIEDARGLSHHAYARAFLRVDHPPGWGEGGAGGDGGSGGGEAGAPGPGGEGGDAGRDDPGEGCATASGPGALLVAAALLLVRRGGTR